MNEFKIGHYLNCISFKVIDPKKDPLNQGIVFLAAEATIQMQRYSATEAGVFLPEELVHFREELKRLYTTLKGSATFSTIENWIGISIKGNGRGLLELNCHLSSSDGRTKLECAFDLDQTYIQSTLTELDLMVAQIV